MNRWILAGLLAPTLMAQSAPAGTVPSRSISELKAFYVQSCVRCHGVDGSATAADGSRLKGRDFTSVQDMKGLKDADMVKTIRKGIFFGISMPAFKDQLSEDEALRLVQDILRKVEKGKPIG